jgi:hypothetical protein
MERFGTIDVLANNADHGYRTQVAVTAALCGTCEACFRCSAQLQQQPCPGIPGLRPLG